MVDALFGWIHAQRQLINLVNSALLSKALVYADNQRVELKVYLSDPDAPIDTNHLP